MHQIYVDVSRHPHFTTYEPNKERVNADPQRCRLVIFINKYLEAIKDEPKAALPDFVS